MKLLAMPLISMLFLATAVEFARASSANLTVVAERLKKHAALYRAHKHVIPAVEPPVDMYLQGFARHPGLVKPHWYIGSLQATQGEALKASLMTAGVPAENITWVEGVTPAAIERGNWSMPGKGTSSERGCTMAHLRMVKTAYDAGHATAVMLEGDASLRLMGLWGRPVALGEKGQTKRGVQSAGIHLADVYSELEKSPWDICQLCLLTMPQKNRDLLEIVQPMLSAMAKGDTIVYRNPRGTPVGTHGRHSQAYGTAAYIVSRAGMARILNSYWPGGEHGPAYSALPRGARFTTHEKKIFSADFILYDTPGGKLKAFLSARPLFDATTKHSDIHPEHSPFHAKSNFLLESMLYPLLPDSSTTYAIEHGPIAIMGRPTSRNVQLARTNRTLHGPLRAPSASLSEPAFGRQQGGYNLPTRQIFFAHTSKEKVLTRVGSCAVSSAAKVNPDWQVTVFSNELTHPEQNPKTRQQSAGSFALFPSWSGPNPPRVVRFEYERIFRGTPFESWYEQKRVWSKHGFTIQNLSNALRLALLYKFGGAYFDLDIISVKPLPPSIWKRSAGLEREVPGSPEMMRLNGAVILMDKQAPFLKEAMKDYVRNFKNWLWGNQGPDLMTRVWNRTHLIDAMPVPMFYPIVWGSPTMMSYFNQPEWDGAKEVLSEITVAIHLWNRKTSKKRWHNESFMTHVLQRVC